MRYVLCLVLLAELTAQAVGSIPGHRVPHPFVVQSTAEGASAVNKPALVVQTGHAAPIYAATFSPDGRIMATGSWDTTIKLWDVQTQKQIRTLSGHRLFVNDVAFSPDGQLLASASYDMTVKVWDVSTGQEHGTLSGNDRAVACVAFSPDGQMIASGSENNRIRLWNVAGMRAITSFAGSGRGVDSVAFSPDGRVLAGAFGGPEWGEVRLWELPSGKPLGVLRGHKARVSDVAFSSTGSILASASWDHSIKLWDYAAQREIVTLNGHDKEVGCLDFSKDGRLLVSGGFDKVVCLWDATTHTLIRKLPGHKQEVRTVAFSPNRPTLITGGWDRTVRLWDYRSGEQIGIFSGFYGTAEAISYSPDGKTLATGGPDHFVRLWNTENWRSSRVLSGHSDGISSVAFNPQGNLLASGSQDKTIRLWNPMTGETVKVLTGHSDEITTIAFRPDGQFLASGTGSVPGEIKIWRISDGKDVGTLKGHENTISSVAFSPDGQILASGSSDGTVRLWNLTTGRCKILSGHDTTVTSVAFSPDGKTLASGGWDGHLRLWKVADGTAVGDLASEKGEVTTVSFYMQGTLLVSGAKSGAIEFWNLATRKRVKMFQGHTQDIRSLSFDPTGQTLATASWDGTIKLWGIGSGTEIASLITPEAGEFIMLTPDNYYMTSPRGYLGVAFRLDNRSYPFEQFDLRLNRPDVVLERLGKTDPRLIDSYRAAYRKRLEKVKLGTTAPADDFHLPEMEILTRDLPISTLEPELTFEIKASETNPQYKLERINVWVNNVPANATLNNIAFGGSKGLLIPGKDSSRIQGNITLKLSGGPNKIEVSCMNSAGVESFRQTVNVSYMPLAALPKPRLFIVAIGVSHYLQSRQNLDFAGQDAVNVADFFKGQARLYEKVYHLILTDENAKREEILTKTSELLKQSKVNDRVILFLAGHGILDRELNYYFATHDFDFDAEQPNGLSYDDIEGLLDGIEAREKLLLMDTCHAGEVDQATTAVSNSSEAANNKMGIASGVKAVVVRAKPGKSYIGLGNSFLLMQELFADLRRGSGAAVIAAASGVQYAYEADGSGVFTHTLLEGLREKAASGAFKADRDGDGIVKISELRDWVLEQVRQATGGRQVPISRRENIQNDWGILERTPPESRRR